MHHAECNRTRRRLLWGTWGWLRVKTQMKRTACVLLLMMFTVIVLADVPIDIYVVHSSAIHVLVGIPGSANPQETQEGCHRAPLFKSGCLCAWGALQGHALMLQWLIDWCSHVLCFHLIWCMMLTYTMTNAFLEPGFHQVALRQFSCGCNEGSRWEFGKEYPPGGPAGEIQDSPGNTWGRETELLHAGACIKPFKFAALQSPICFYVKQSVYNLWTGTGGADTHSGTGLHPNGAAAGLYALPVIVMTCYESYLPQSHYHSVAGLAEGHGGWLLEVSLWQGHGPSKPSLSWEVLIMNHWLTAIMIYICCCCCNIPFLPMY